MLFNSSSSQTLSVLLLSVILSFISQFVLLIRVFIIDEVMDEGEEFNVCVIYCILSNRLFVVIYSVFIYYPFIKQEVKIRFAVSAITGTSQTPIKEYACNVPTIIITKKEKR